MGKYRVSFNNCSQDKRYCIDVDACSMDEALNMVLKAKGEWARKNGYTDATASEIPTDASVIGVCFNYEDTVFREKSVGYLFIKANDEKHAKDYYNKNYKGKRFWFKPGVIDDTGKNLYGTIKETYFAAAPGFDADATKESA